MENDYEVLCRLGEGAFGKVYKARHRRTLEEVAVKQIKLGSRSWEEACRSTELQALKQLRHPFIVRLRELIRSQWDGSLYYIFEFLDSDLCRLVKEHTSGYDEMKSAELVRQLFAGVAHMHQHNFFHRDLKPENILLSVAEQTIRIADLGQARSLRARPPFTDYVGTRWYRAPECLLRDRTYSSPVDVWASGLIFAELLRGSPVFCGTSTIDQLYKIFLVLGHPLVEWPDFARLAQAVRFRVPDRAGCGLLRVLPAHLSPQVVALLTEILVLVPRRRPSARKCLEHEFFAQFPALDIERLDTHRSRSSTTTFDSKLDDIKAGPSLSPRGGGSVDCISSGVAEVGTDIDLDAELDAILGDASGQGSPHPVDALPSSAAARSGVSVAAVPSPLRAGSSSGSLSRKAAATRPGFAFAPGSRSRTRELEVLASSGFLPRAGHGTGDGPRKPTSPTSWGLDTLLADLGGSVGLGFAASDAATAPGAAADLSACAGESCKPLGPQSRVQDPAAALEEDPLPAAPPPKEETEEAAEEEELVLVLTPPRTTRISPSGASVTSSPLPADAAVVEERGDSTAAEDELSPALGPSAKDWFESVEEREGKDDADVGSSGACDAADLAAGDSKVCHRRNQKCQLWSPAEASQLRKVVKRIIRRGTRDKEALWVEVSSEIGNGRAPRECKTQYARDHRAHKAVSS